MQIRLSNTILLICLLITLNTIGVGMAQESAQINVIGRSAPSSRLGITFINSAQTPQDEQRYRNALSLGAGWTRWPLLWNHIERAPGQFDWSAYDQLVIDDIQHGLLINAILLDRPGFYADGAIIAGLNEPIFADGTDTPANGKELNPNNPWAIFVFQAIQRYKPGGTLARQQGWINGEGVTIWEVWNEPDLELFWQGGIINYARLLKVAYLSAKMADPTATVMFGGLLFSTPNNWLAQVLNIYINDPFAAQYNWYMDAVALHSYSYPWRTGWLTLYVRETLDAFELDRPIIVNETGISVWNDYPGPVWTGAAPEQRLKLGTLEQQAWFFVQSTAYAFLEGADVVFFHQLYDDCGDQPAGTNFPPNDGSLCNSGQACFGDAFGLYRNVSDSICYSQHPSPGTARPAANAFRLMSQVFGVDSFLPGAETRIDGITDITFARPGTNERVHIIWNRRFEPNTAIITAEGSSASLLTLDGTHALLPVEGVYRIDLQPAMPDSFPEMEAQDISAIGGKPVILIEVVEGDLNLPPIIQGVPATNRAGAAPQTPLYIAPTVVPFDEILPTPGAVIPQPAQPTTVPENDTQPPVTRVSPLPETSPSIFTVEWGADDNGQVARYVVWVQINEGDWSPWLETERTSGMYTGIAGNRYRFAVWAVDTAGNWSTNTNLQPQAETRVQ